MRILFFCPLWGSENLKFSHFVQQVKAGGYDGVEMSLPFNDPQELNHRIALLKDASLLFIGQHWETVNTNLEMHKKEYQDMLFNLASGNPIFINSQTGRDFFSFEQNQELIEVATAFTAKTGIRVLHETHRGKFSFAAHITKNFLLANEQLRITADFSHWTNVAETMLQDQPEAVNLAINRADHIHARVGFQEGPQIPDPRAAEWEETIHAYLTWWDRMIQRADSEGKEVFTITPEFGPYPYMTILPHSREPISNQWDVNLYMMSFLKKRYSNKIELVQ